MTCSDHVVRKYPRNNNTGLRGNFSIAQLMRTFPHDMLRPCCEELSPQQQRGHSSITVLMRIFLHDMVRPCCEELSPQLQRWVATCKDISPEHTGIN